MDQRTPDLETRRHAVPRGLKVHLSLEETLPGQLKFLLAVPADSGPLGGDMRWYAVERTG